jgi:hypothetical protein
MWPFSNKKKIAAPEKGPRASEDLKKQPAFPETLLQLSSVFEDAIRALSQHSDRLTIPPLPATVYLMQIDVINHYQHALDHYFTVPLNAPFLQNSSFGTPYQKWAHVNNENFDRLSFAIHNLLRYTSRMIHESECLDLADRREFSEISRLSNSYTDPICEIKNQEKQIGIAVLPDNQLAVTPLRFKGKFERLTGRAVSGSPTQYFRIVQGSDGNDREEPIDWDEFKRLSATVRSSLVDIADRTQLLSLRELGLAEIADLQERNRAYKKICDHFYRKSPVTAPFEKLNESYWI